MVISSDPPSMEFLPSSSWIALKKFLIKDMESIVVIKLLGHNIGYGVLH
ncbi:hypothetical protein Goari_023615, partial [Gossypium aridum]|nr:hypothetical protein [Gossypium aridum]